MESNREKVIIFFILFYLSISIIYDDCCYREILNTSKN